MSPGAELMEKMLVSPDGAPLPRIHGYETEYGIDYFKTEAEGKNSKFIHVIRDEVAKVALRLFDQQYREGGQRIYVDHGHPEYATPEGEDFLETAYRVLAGHMEIKRLYATSAHIVGDLIAAHDLKVDFDYDPGKVEITANTTSPNGASWGSHKNLLTRHGLMPGDYKRALVAHNVARLVWQGAGAVGVDPVSGKYRFELSEKAPFICEIANDETTRDRPIVNMRYSPLANRNRYRRIHDVSSDSNINPYTIALSLAATSIVLRACELGTPFDDLFPLHPVKAIHEVGADATLQTKVDMELSSKRYTGVEMQMIQAERAINAATKADYLTEAEASWGANWLTLLDDIRRDPESCASRVDWVTKQKLINRELAAKADSDESPLSIAWAKSVDYHRILPYEGAGMRLVRRGFFEGSPSSEQIDMGIALPKTRARARAELIKAARNSGHPYEARWDTVYLKPNVAQAVIGEPYEMMNPAVAEFIERYSGTAPAA